MMQPLEDYHWMASLVAPLCAVWIARYHFLEAGYKVLGRKPPERRHKDRRQIICPISHQDCPLKEK